MATSRPFIELQAALQAARDDVTQRLAAKRTELEAGIIAAGGVVSWNWASVESTVSAAIADAQATFDAELAANARGFIAWALRELTTCARTFRTKGDAESATAFLRKLRQVGNEKLRLTGRALGCYGEPHEAFLAMAKTFITDLPSAIVAFSDPHALSSITGTPQAVDRVMRATEHPEFAAEAVEALRALEAVCSRIATSRPGAVVTDEIRALGALLLGEKPCCARANVARSRGR